MGSGRVTRSMSPTTPNPRYRGMALHFEIKVNRDWIGEVEIRRLGSVGLDGIGTYTVSVVYKGRMHHAEIKHRYDDGAIILIRKALAAVEAATIRKAD